jgi:hypothetical protein
MVRRLSPFYTLWKLQAFAKLVSRDTVYNDQKHSSGQPAPCPHQAAQLNTTAVEGCRHRYMLAYLLCTYDWNWLAASRSKDRDSTTALSCLSIRGCLAAMAAAVI